jgi:hypothetical protein
MGGLWYFSWCHILEKKERKKERDNSDVATLVNYGVASSSSWSKSICNPKMGHYENEFAPVPRLVPPSGFKDEHLDGHIQAGRHLNPTPKGKPLDSHMDKIGNVTWFKRKRNKLILEVLLNKEPK